MNKVVSVLTAALMVLLTGVVQAHSVAGEHTPTIVVSATGTTDVAPDMAIVTMTVHREAKTARSALDTSNSAMASVQQAMKGLKIAPRDMQTSGFSIQPMMSRPNRSQPDRTPKVIGYAVQNSLTVRVRDLNLVGRLLDQAVTLGVNQGGQIQFTNAQPQKSISQARANAMKAAIAKANTLVGAAGVGLGNIQNISETSRAPRPMPMARGRMAAMADSGEVPVQAGENTYSVSVSVTWQIRQ